MEEVGERRPAPELQRFFWPPLVREALEMRDGGKLLHRVRRIFLPCVASLVAAATIAGVASATGANGAAQPGYSVVMRGLDNPRGLTFGPAHGNGEHDGPGGSSLYVAEAGRG